MTIDQHYDLAEFHKKMLATLIKQNSQTTSIFKENNIYKSIRTDSNRQLILFRDMNDRSAMLSTLPNNKMLLRHSKGFDHVELFKELGVVTVVCSPMNAHLKYNKWMRKVPYQGVPSEYIGVGYIHLEIVSTIEIPRETYKDTTIPRWIFIESGGVYAYGAVDTTAIRALCGLNDVLGNYRSLFMRDDTSIKLRDDGKAWIFTKGRDEWILLCSTSVEMNHSLRSILNDMNSNTRTEQNVNRFSIDFLPDTELPF